MLGNIRKRTFRMLKAVIGITMSASMICSNLVCAFAQSEYPYSSKYPTGIEDADISFFTEREINHPLDMNFESNEEIEFVKANSQNEQITLSEDAYEGKFAIDIKPTSTEKLLIKDTEYFSVGKNITSPVLYSVRKTNAKNSINISVNDKKITINGVTTPNAETTIMILDKNEEIAYIDQLAADKNGIFMFDFVLQNYGTYNLRIGNVGQEIFEQELTLKSETITDESIQVPESVDTKTNLLKLWIKPKYKAESISFYVTALVDGEEKQIVVFGDKDSDGVFKVSEDLALGKWQQITLDFLKLEEIPDSATVKDFYVSANQGSEWVIDSVTSSYRENSSSSVSLEQFATDNVIFNEEGEVVFSETTDGEYKNSSKVVTGSIDTNEMISGITVDSEFRKNTEFTPSGYTNDKISSYPIPTEDTTVFSGDYKKLFFKNKDDNNYIYCMDTSTLVCTKVLEISYDLKDASYTGDKIETSNGIYDTETGEHIPYFEHAREHYLSPSGDVFAARRGLEPDYYHQVYKYSDGSYNLFYTREWFNRRAAYTMSFSSNGEYFAVGDENYWTLYKNTENGCEYIDRASVVSSEYVQGTFISNDGTKLFVYDRDYEEQHIYDFVTGVHEELSDRYLSQAKDGRYLIKHETSKEVYYYLYDEVTGNEEKIYYESFGTRYCSDRNWFLDVVNYELRIVDHNMNTEHNKYLLSFDGKKTWYAYDGGKWILASSSPVPNIEEMRKNGMTKEEINIIPEEAYKKFYENGFEVYTLNFAIGMFGSTKDITPVVKSISVDTIANQPVDYIYSSKLFTFDKSDYNKINAMFPVEDFPKVSECYYLLYLGNEWLYTYKDGKVIKLDFTAESIAQQTEENWLKVKKSGLTVNEVRSIPQSILTELFLNSEFANTKFGVIAISKVKDDTTATYNVEVKLSADVRYITEDNYYLEISLSGAEKIIYTPEQITKTQIDDFLSWLDERQNGNGDIFYRIQTEEGQKFINYYNITNVNVYKNNDNLQ